MAKKKQSSNLDFIITKLKNCVGDIKVIEHSNGVSFGGIHEVNQRKSTVTIINEIGLERIKNAEEDNLSTEEIYQDPSCLDIIELKNVLKVK